MKDPELESLVRAIEGWLSRHNGREQVLSPADFRLARSWRNSGVPLSDILAALDAVAAGGQEVHSLGFCRGKLLAGTRAPRHG